MRRRHWRRCSCRRWTAEKYTDFRRQDRPVRLLAPLNLHHGPFYRASLNGRLLGQQYGLILNLPATSAEISYLTSDLGLLSFVILGLRRSQRWGWLWAHQLDGLRQDFAIRDAYTFYLRLEAHRRGTLYLGLRTDNYLLPTHNPPGQTDELHIATEVHGDLAGRVSRRPPVLVRLPLGPLFDFDGNQRTIGLNARLYFDPLPN